MNGRLRGLLPASWRARLALLRARLMRRPRYGLVQFGDLRRLEPVSRTFGFECGRPIDRVYIEGFLERSAACVSGRVLEVAEATYTRRFGGDRVTRSDILHVRPDSPGVTIVGDLASGDGLPSDAFDCIILTQTLQFIFDLQGAVATIHRVLRPGGTVLATCHGLSQVSRYDMDRWGEFWRFTSLSARRLFEEAFEPDAVSVEAYGNVLSSVAFLHGLTADELAPEELQYRDPDYELLIAIRAVKRA